MRRKKVYVEEESLRGVKSSRKMSTIIGSSDYRVNSVKLAVEMFKKKTFQVSDFDLTFHYVTGPVTFERLIIEKKMSSSLNLRQSQDLLALF